MEDLSFRRNVDPAARRKNNKSLVELASLRQQYSKTKLILETTEKKLSIERETLELATANLENARNALSDVQAEIDADYLPEGAQPRKRIQDRDSLAQIVKEEETAMELQRKVTQIANDDFRKAEQEFFVADRDLHKFAGTLEDVVEAKELIDKLDAEKLERVRKIEERAAATKEKTLRLRKEAVEAQEKDLADYNEKQSKIVEKLNKEARKKMADHNAKTTNLTQQVKTLHEQEMENRIEAVLELKTNVNAVRAEVATQSAKHVRKVEWAKKQLEDEKDTLLAQGLNPYVEFRRKEFEAEASAREKKMKEAVEKNKANLAVQMEKERILLEKQDKAKRLAAKLEKEHRDSLGRHVIEERNKDYIVEKTTAHTEVLDPSGKAARIDPSQITDIADFTFGLGNSVRIPKESMKRITEQIRAELKVDKNNFGEYKRLVSGLSKAVGEEEEEESNSDPFSRSMSAPGGKRADLEDTVSETNNDISKRELHNLESLGANMGAIPGSDNATLSVNLNNDKTLHKTLLIKTTEEEGDIVDEDNKVASLSIAKYPAAPLSKFERDALDRAKERHRDRIESGVEQLAGGKVFQGDSFASTPAVILFKDFDVNKVYKQKFVLTNVSYTFNSFKMLDLEDEFIDFFVITFDKPGRMSAGLSCTVDITFKPQVNQDIFTQIKLLTETGPVFIPLQCLIKRCAPKIITSDLDFEEVIVGQRVLLPVKVVNSQALPTRYSIAEVGIEPEDAIADQDDSNAIGDETVKVTGDEGAEESPESSGDGKLTIDVDGAAPQQAMGGEEYVSNEFASNEAELWARVRRIMTAILRQKKKDQPNPFVCFVSSKTIHGKEHLIDEGLLDGYSSTNLTVRCAPLNVGLSERQFRVRFEDVDESQRSVDEKGELILKDQIISVRVTGEELPIYVEDEIVDLKCTLFDRIYRRKLNICNRGKIAYRVTVKVAKHYLPFVEVSPTIFFVQALSSQSVNIKLAPTREMMQKMKHYLFPNEIYPNAGLLAVPVEIQVVNQDLPVYFVVKSIVCPSTIEVSEPQLDFGRVYVGQKSMLTITMKNTSMLAQKIAFVRLRKEFSVSPNDGFAVLLPLEELTFTVSFAPQSAIEYKLELTVMTSWNDKIVIPIIAEGVEPPFELSKSVFHLRSTAPGQRVLDSFFVRNALPVQQSFEIMVPDKRVSWINVTPLALNLAPGQTGRVEIEYLPPRDLAETDPTRWFEDLAANSSTENPPFDEWVEENSWKFGKNRFGDVQWTISGLPSSKEIAAAADAAETETGTETEDHAPEVAGNEGSEEDEQKKRKKKKDEEERLDLLPSEDWGVIGKWNIPLFIKPRRKALALATESGASASVTASASALAPLFINIETVVTRPELEASVHELDFGQIAVTTRVLKSFRIFNRGVEGVKLKAVGVNAMGPFNVLRPIKWIGAGESIAVIVECLPPVPGLTVEILEILSEDESVGGHRLCIPLRVQGLMPAIQLDGLAPPPSNWNPRSGILDMGNVLVCDAPTIKTFTVKNKSSFAIDTRIVRVVSDGLAPREQLDLIERTAAGLPLISVRPERVTIPQGGQEQIEVIFRPDRTRFLPFREDFDVVVGQTDEVLRVGVLGRAWTRQYAMLPESSADEMFVNNWLRVTACAEDIFQNCTLETVRKKATEAKKENGLSAIPSPVLTLQFPDPFAAEADPSSYTVIDPAAAGGAKGGAKAPAAAAAAAPANAEASRRQVKRLKLVCAKPANASLLDSKPATFEIILDNEARQSGLWSFSAEKGSVTTAKDEIIDVICTQSRPRKLAGVSVGSWKTFDATVVIKGGWFPSGETDENRIPLRIKAFVSI